MSTDRTIDADDRQAIRTCHICEVSCGLALQVRRDGTVASVRGDAFDTYSSGYLCAKGAAIGALDADPDRLLEPRIRRNGRLEVVGWDEAFAEVDRLLRPHLDGDRSALALFTGNPSGHNFAGTILQPALEAALGTPNKYSVSTIDQMPQTLAATLMYGGPTAVPIADVDRTDHMVIVGANPFVSNGSLGGGPRYPQRIRAIRDRGGSVVVIDPATTRTARAADRHIAIRPGTDAMLLLSVVRELFVRDAIDLGNAAGKVDDLDAVRSAVSPFTPGAVATPCGVDPGVVGPLADGLITARTAVVQLGDSVAQRAHRQSRPRRRCDVHHAGGRFAHHPPEAHARPAHAPGPASQSGPAGAGAARRTSCRVPGRGHPRTRRRPHPWADHLRRERRPLDPELGGGGAGAGGGRRADLHRPVPQ